MTFKLYNYLRKISCLILICILMAVPQHSFALDQERMIAVKAAYLFRFALFVQWPQPLQGSFNICIANDKVYAHKIAKILDNKTIQELAVQVVAVGKRDNLKRCQLLFMPENTPDITLFLANAAAYPVLTLGESRDFYQHEGMIYLYMRHNKIRFSINLNAAQQVDLKIKAQLMALSEVL